MRDALADIFRDVRNNFIWRPDDEREIEWNNGKLIIKDIWQLMQPDSNGVLRGDCEDFSLYCSKMIKKILEIPKEYRKLTYCETETGEGHMVLVVYIDDRDYVFDNRQRKLTSLRKLKRSGYKDFAQPDGPINSVWREIDA